ncbi:helix-turn-helix domain-containing protein [Streptomyces sp. NPDC002520]
MKLSVPEEAYSGTVRKSPMGRLQIATIEGDPLVALRTRRLMGQGDDDYVVVNLLDRGVARLEQDTRDVALRSGEIFIYDTTRPFRLMFPEHFQTKSLILPRQIHGLSEPVLRQITASPLGADTALGGLLSVLLSQLADTAGSYRPHTGELLARKVADLLSVLADERLGETAGRSPRGEAAMLLRIQAFIRRHLTDPDLTPEVIADAHHISLRYLHRIFEGEESTVRRWIQSRRLEGCRRDLTQRGAANLTISAVAHRWGFTSATHFSRLFRAAYGMSPSDWRDAQMS